MLTTTWVYVLNVVHCGFCCIYSRQLQIYFAKLKKNCDVSVRAILGEGLCYSHYLCFFFYLCHRRYSMSNFYDLEWYSALVVPAIHHSGAHFDDDATWWWMRQFLISEFAVVIFSLFICQICTLFLYNMWNERDW